MQGITAELEAKGLKVIPLDQAREYVMQNGTGQLAKTAAVNEDWEPPVSFNEYDLPEFPIDSLPSWVRGFVVGLARETQTPVDLPAMLVLAACAGAVGGKVEIQAMRRWKEPLNLFVAVSQPPGSRKSAVFSAVIQPIEAAEASLIADMREIIARSESEYRTLAARLDHLEKAAAKIDDEGERRAKQQEAAEAAKDLASFEVPKQPKLLIDDTTPETLATLLSDQHGRIAALSPEGDLFDAIAGRYSTGAPNLGVFLKGHAGENLRVDRRGRSEFIYCPALTIGLALQPDVIRGLVSKPQFKGRGLLGRFLYSMPKSLLGSRKTRVQPLDDEARAEYSRRVRAMTGLMVGFDEDGNRQPRMIYLTTEAEECIVAFSEELEPHLAETGELGSLSDWAAKLAGAVLRIAGILHLAEHAGQYSTWPDQVSATTLKKAIEIGHYLIPHAQSAYAEMGADPGIEAAKFLLKWVLKWRDGGQVEFRKQDAWQGTKGRFKKVLDLEKALTALEEQGFVRSVVEDQPKKRGRKPGGIYEINPLANSYNSYNSCKTPALPNSRNLRDCRNNEADKALNSSSAIILAPKIDTREVLSL